MADPPTHIVDAGTERTRCGIKMNNPARFPYVRAEHVAAHVAGHGLVVCPDCEAADAR